MSNVTGFDNSHSVWNERIMPVSKVWISPVLMQNPDIWIFQGSPTLNNGQLIRYFKSLWYAIASNMIHFFRSVWHEKKNVLV